MSHQNLLIYGAGHVGIRVGAKWKSQFPYSNVFAVTATTARHDILKTAGLEPLLADQSPPYCGQVLFSVPPSENYLAVASQALRQWDKNGPFVFTSSTSVFLENSNGPVTELSKLNPENRIFGVEKLIEQNGGCIVRLAGLYNEERGPHIYLLKSMKIRSSPNSFLNLIHSDDAATLCVKALQAGEAGAHYLGSDSHPIRQIDFANAVLGSAEARKVTFGSSPDSGKQCDSRWTREALDWQPKYNSFIDWQNSN
jgi:nucleoside-diphosphate-sugar epimerase